MSDNGGNASDELSQHIFAFGSPVDTIYGHMVLGPNGKISGYRHANESAWRLSADGALEFISETGSRTSYLKAQSGSAWLGRTETSVFPVMLVSALRHDAKASAPAIVVNSIPKAGTYFLEAALSAAGFPGSGLHLAGERSIDDYRGLSPAEMHSRPEQRRLLLPVELVPCITPGHTTPAHVERAETVQRMLSSGAHVIHVKRDLRDVIISLFRFKLERVEPTDALDGAWRAIDGQEQLCAFLFHYAERDIAHIREMAHLIADRPALAFEDMISANIPEELRDQFDAIRPGLSADVAAGLAAVRGRATSTLSKERSDWRAHWSPKIQQIFVALGLEEANRHLGYE